MQHLRLLIITLFSSIFILCSCKKNMVEETYTPIINPVIPDFGSKITSAVNGFITDENGEAVEGATVTAGAVTTSTDVFGYFSIDNTLFAKSAGFIQVKKDGYFTGYRTFVPVPRKQTFIRLQLVPNTNTDIIESLAGGTVSFNGNASVTLPADAVVFGSNNSAYTGPVYVAAHWFDPSDMQNTSLTMPGDLTGIDSIGHLNVLQTFGMVAVELTGTNGQKLKLAPGKKALLHFPLPGSLQGAAPRYIPLWYFDETKGVWQQEAHAVRNGDAYDGEVSHFSYWNCDVGFPLVNFTAQFVNLGLTPLINTPVSISATDITGSARMAYTDTNGMVYGLVPANSNLKVDLFAACDQSVYSQVFSTNNSPVDLGTHSVTAEQYSATIKGSVISCSGTPVTNGYAIIETLANNTVVPVYNGNFSMATLICQAANAGVVAIDLQTAEQSQASLFTITNGTNNVGQLQACNSLTSEIITVSTPAITYAPPQYLFGGNYYLANDSTSISAIDLLNGNQEVFQLSFAGYATAGSHLLTSAVHIGTDYFAFMPGTMADITYYGLVGQFITGTVSGTTSPPNSRRLTIQFNIQRDQ